MVFLGTAVIASGTECFYEFEKILLGVGFEPTIPFGNQILSLAP